MGDTVVRPFKLAPDERALLVSHRERVDTYFRDSLEGLQLSQFFGPRSPASLDDFATFDVKPTILVQELKYPGDRTSPVVNKWIYVFNSRNNTMILEAYSGFVSHKGEDPFFHVLCKDFPAPPNSPWDGGPPSLSEDFNQIIIPFDVVRGAAGIPLQITQADSPFNILVFVSPWRFDSDCYDEIVADTRGHNFKTEAFVPARGGVGSGLFAVAVDPWDWATDCVNHFVNPAGLARARFMADGDLHAKLAIASMLKQWTSNGDPLGVANELQDGQPDAFIADYEAKELAVRAAHEQAAGYHIATCVDSPEHRLVEIAASQGGAAGQEFVGVNFCVHTFGLAETLAGREYFLNLVADENRYIARQITPDGTPFFSLANYGTHRWLWYAGWVSLGEIQGAWLTRKRAIAALDSSAEEKLLLFFKHLGANYEKTADPGALCIYQDLKRDILGGQTLASAAYRNSSAHVDLVNEVDKSIRIHADRGGVIEMSEVNVAGTALNKIFNTSHGAKVAGIAKSIHTTVKVPLDALNLFLAFQALAQSNPGQGLAKSISALGALADASALALEIGGKRWGMREVALRGWGKGLGMVSGACDMYDMAGQAGTAYDRGTTGQLIGASLGVAGGATVALSGALGLLSATTPMFGALSFAGPVGLIASTVGTALLLTAGVIINLATANPYEQFAFNSFLGKGAARRQPGGDLVFFDWAPAGMPCAAIADESRVLTALISNYKVTVTGTRDQRELRASEAPPRIELHPGELDHSAVFVVEVTQVFTLLGYDAPHAYSCRFTFHETTDVFGQDSTSGLYLDTSTLDIQRDASKRIQTISIPLRPVFLGDPSRFDHSYAYLVRRIELVQHRVRIQLRSQVNRLDPYHLTYEVNVLTSDGFSSFDHSNVVQI